MEGSREMKKMILGLGIGLLVGALVMGFVMYKMAPGMMLLEDESKFGFEATVEKLKQSVDKHGWKLPKVHDLQKTMAKFNVQVRPVQVFELCHPDHAAKILKEGDERIVSSMMPCRVAIYEKPNGKVYVSRMNTSLMAGMMGGLVAEVMDHASAENEEILGAVLN